MGKSFNAQIEAWVAKTEAALVEVVKKSILEAARRIIKGTPVATGRARANWQISIDNKGEDSSLVDIDKSGEKTLAKIEAELNKVTKFTQFVTLRNNLAYILPLEYGHSKQAPNGMVRLTLQQWDAIVADAVKSVKSK